MACNDMVLSAVVIWYNPDETCIENIRSYEKFVKTIYVVDNSNTNNSEFLKEFKNAKYIPLFSNEGIAKAQNIGCQNALDDGFIWCMTMDQDSSWDEDQIKRMVELCKKYDDEKNVSFAPNYTDIHFRSYLGDIKHFIFRMFGRDICMVEKKDDCEIMPCDKVIASGNIINLNVWKDVGGYYEPFFIDEVDHEFCFRLKKNGYNILKFPHVILNHKLGSPKKFFYPSLGHSPLRHYYMSRNIMYLSKMHPDFYKKLQYKSRISLIIKSAIFNLNFSRLKFILQGVNDFYNDRFGKYENLHKSKKINGKTSNSV